MKLKSTILSFCLIIFFQTAWAGKIYRWTDSEGNVQFTSTPGPDQSADAHQGGAKKTAINNDYDIDDILKGNWYGSNRTSSIELRFSKDVDFLDWKSRPRSGGVRAESFKAKWKYINSDLELRYTNHKPDSDKNGTTEIIKIVDKTLDTMILQFPDGKVYRLNKRIKNKSYSREERKFNGTWELKNKKKTVWKFGRRGFVIKGIPYNQYNAQTLASGNWEVQGDRLILTHLNDDHVWKKIKKAGQEERFTILLQERGKIILKTQDGGKQIVLHRKR